jgi:hypothetical protein
MNNTEYMMTGFTTAQTFNNEKKSSCFLFHKWTKWKRYDREMKHVHFTTGQTFNYLQEVQERVCLKCGKTQIEILN